MADKTFNCYECRHRRDVPGDAHSQCKHPDIGDRNPISELMALAGAIRSFPMGLITEKGAKKLNIKGNAHGITKGWFSWPYNFDPVWLENCNGFELIGKEKKPPNV